MPEKLVSSERHMPQRLATTARGSLINCLSDVVLSCGHGRWPTRHNEVAPYFTMWHLSVTQRELCLAILVVHLDAQKLLITTMKISIFSSFFSQYIIFYMS